MNRVVSFAVCYGWLLANTSCGQTTEQLDNSKLPVDSLQRRIDHLMQMAKVSDVAMPA